MNRPVVLAVLVSAAWLLGSFSACGAAWGITWGTAQAQEARPDDGVAQDRVRETLTRRAGEMFGRAEYADAERVLRELLELTPSDSVVLYNLALARSAQHDGPGAMNVLERALEAGFDDIRRLRREPLLRSARDTERFRQLDADWTPTLESRKQAVIAGARALLTGDVIEHEDPRLRLVYLSAFDPTSTARARAELDMVAAWAEQTLFPGASDPAQLALDPWVVIVLPRPPDFRRWAASIGDNAPAGSLHAVGGGYFHDDKRLVSQDLGSSLRHEFMHILHWRDCTRRGHVHPIWVQEGLCSLVEDYDRDDLAAFTPAPSWRTNITKRLESGGKHITLARLASFTRDQFVSQRPLANYAAARTVFLFLAQRGVLSEWYRMFAASPNKPGAVLDALSEALGAPLLDVERQYRSFVRELPEVPEQVVRGGASLGVEVDAGRGEGPVIALVLEPSARAAGLRPGDVITAVAGRTTRDIPELVRVLGTLTPGSEVELEYTRAGVHASTRVTLSAR